MNVYHDHNTGIKSRQLKNKAWFYPIQIYSHYGVNDYLPCKLCKQGGTWHLVFTDGYIIDTRYDSSIKNGFSRERMREDLTAVTEA